MLANACLTTCAQVLLRNQVQRINLHSNNIRTAQPAFSMSDSSLQRLREGDQAAFREFVEEHHRRVLRLVMSFVGNTEDSEDIAQEVFLEAYKALPSFYGASALSTWLHRIAVNASLDFLRAKSRHKRFAIRVPLFDRLGGLVVDPADPAHPGTLLEDQERSRVLYAAINSLAEQQRVAFVLCEIDGCSMKEAAELMNTSAKAVESLLSRARGRLRTMLKGYYDEHK